MQAGRLTGGGARRATPPLGCRAPTDLRAIGLRRRSTLCTAFQRGKGGLIGAVLRHQGEPRGRNGEGLGRKTAGALKGRNTSGSPEGARVQGVG